MIITIVNIIISVNMMIYWWKISVSTASARSQWALRDLNCECKMSDRMSEEMLDRMPDRMSDYARSDVRIDMSDRISVGRDHSKKDIWKSVPLNYRAVYIPFCGFSTELCQLCKQCQARSARSIIQFEELDKQLFADMMKTTGWGTSVIQEDSEHGLFLDDWWLTCSMGISGS